ncbi:TPA: hypothetical protein ACPPBA_000267 [Haemophilus influenzae]
MVMISHIHFTVGLRPPYEVLGDVMKCIHFTVGLRPPYEVLGYAMKYIQVMDTHNI